MTTSDENPLDDTDLEARPSAAVPKILWVIPIAALLIVAAVVFRQLNGPLWIKAGGGGLVTRRAPAIVLQDQNSEFVHTVRYLDRQKLIVVFYNGELGPEQSQQLLLLRDGFSQIEAAGAEIVAVSSASPYRNREGATAAGGIPFPMLSDVDFSVQREWGIVGEAQPDPQPGLFLIDSRGNIRWERIGAAEPVTLETLLTELAKMP